MYIKNLKKINNNQTFNFEKKKLSSFFLFLFSLNHFCFRFLGGTRVGFPLFLVLGEK